MPISHVKNNTIADFTGTATVYNSAGATATVLATDLVRPSDWNSNHLVSLSASEMTGIWNFANGLSSTTAAGGITVGMQSDPWFAPFPLFNSASTQMTLSSPGIGTWYIDGPIEVDQVIGSGQIHNFVAGGSVFFQNGSAYSAASTGSVSRFQTWYNNFAFYKQGAGASTSRLESLWTMKCSLLASHELRLSTANTSSGTISNYLTLSFPSQWDASGGVTYGSTSKSGTTQFGTSTAASTYANNLITGAGAYVSGSRMDIFPMSTTLAPGAYWVGHMFTTSSSSQGTAGGIGSASTLFPTMSVVGRVELLANVYKQIGRSVSNSTSGILPYHGYLATTTFNATSIINTSDIRNTTGQMYWNYFQSTY